MKRFKSFLEEEGAPTNNVGGGNIAGLGIGPKGEPGVSATRKKKKTPVIAILRRKGIETFEPNKDVNEEVQTGTFAGVKTFVVPSDVFFNARLEKQKGKHWSKYIGELKHADAVRAYANKDVKKPIILQDEKTGSCFYARYGKK